MEDQISISLETATPGQPGEARRGLSFRSEVTPCLTAQPKRDKTHCSRNASAGRNLDAYSAGHTVAARQTKIAKSPVSANSTGWIVTGRCEMKYTFGSRGKP